jgi:hypothetical protein
MVVITDQVIIMGMVMETIIEEADIDVVLMVIIVQTMKEEINKIPNEYFISFQQ